MSRFNFGDEDALTFSGPQGEDLQPHFDIANHLASGKVVDRSHDVPAFGGSSNDNKTVYIDRHVPQSLMIQGKPVDVAPFITIHESVEHDLMSKGMPYLPAHIRGTAAERAAVEKAGIDWKSYEAHIDGMLHKIEHEPIVNPPKDLYTKVYHIPAWGGEGAKLDAAIAGARRHEDPRE